MVIGVLFLGAAAAWPADLTVSSSTTAPADVPGSTVDPPSSDRPASARAAGREVTTTTARPGPAPVGLRIPVLGVDTPVVPVGVDRATGGMEIPEDVTTVGWYRYGPGFDASRGSTVLAGHVDRAGQEGALFELRTVRLGETLVLAGPDGRTRSHVVVSRDQWSKSRVPLERLFARDGPPRLVVITCGGRFDEGSRSYRDNVVITAAPTGEP